VALLVVDEAVISTREEDVVAAEDRGVEGAEIALLISDRAVVSITEEETVAVDERGFDEDGSGVLMNRPSESTGGTKPVPTVVGSVFVAGTTIPIPDSSLIAVP
jgi:hypothetical protein